ncbi:hypothetical protein Nepgr_029872 [Nepenthes gracilis]|uniref:Thylakoid lumenal 17.9 kDa protein, chloroplastic n=1 Tax=Nepenthes gracilis TaxID=150966 RepID=A0AAD3TF45_NEPGR|nr:hypothetical protein Nepgr_029872 [Nepenthes gracilis]
MKALEAIFGRLCDAELHRWAGHDVPLCQVRCGLAAAFHFEIWRTHSRPVAPVYSCSQTVRKRHSDNSMSLRFHLLSPFVPISKSQTHKTISTPQLPIQAASFEIPSAKHSLLLSIAVALTLNSPLPSLAIPPFGSQQPPLLSPTTPFSQSKNLQLGLENGKIRPCPSFNPGCVSSNPKSSSFAFPWQIPANSTENAIQKLQEAIMKTQKNAKIQVVEDSPNGQYLQAEIDGGFGRDVLEFLVKGDVVAYRCMATQVNYVYPFTTAFGDSKGQQERIKRIVDQLGWYAPSFDSMD